MTRPLKFDSVLLISRRPAGFSVLLCLAVVLLSGMPADAARVLFFQAGSGNPEIEQRLELACRFYGIDLEKNGSEKSEYADSRDPVAVVVDAAVLGELTPSDIPRNVKVMLITGINHQTPAGVVEAWSEGTVSVGESVITNEPRRFLTVAPERGDVAHELAGQNLPIDIAQGFCLKADPHSAIISYTANKSLFVRISRPPGSVYFLADLSVLRPKDADIWFYDYGFFAEIAPYMIFIKQAFGASAWHTDGDYANLSIDDPWLRDSYGQLHFADLLREMDQADFHTTIAFIPWNYDRTFSPDVVRMFRERSDRFSLCVHGNNHDHREFYRYKNLPGSRWPASPLPVQAANIRQGLARMEALQKASGLSYDPVMVFPHEISPEPTLELLRKYNFLATANAGNVPLDTPPPRDPLFWLRRTSDLFGGGLASLDRTEAHNRTVADIAIDLFLDNPVLFVEHLLFFANDPAAFNPIARQVKKIQPEVHWASLGSIAKHLYLMRDENDGTCEVRMFSPEIILHNSGAESRLYRITKKDPGNIPVQQVLVENQPVPFIRTNGVLQLSLRMPGGAVRHIQIDYQNSFDPAQESLSKTSFRINTLRRLSDFRDIYLTSGPTGFLIDHLYYKSNLYRFGMKGLGATAFIVLLIPVALAVALRKRRRTHRDD